MCECMKKLGDELQQRLMEKVPQGAEVSTNIFDKVGWDNQCLGLSSGNIYVMLKYRLAYRAPKKNGELAKNFTRLETNVKMSYCPFCGEKQE
ncbi:hypothetical protein vBKpnSCarvaje_0035 [Klebsiella phage vB_KpnS-Carvaje]|jgi:hypothetical protein|uniref:Uncharacterized protein n=1 Tax=Klebsiella phage vB_KpnS-Carvaje TaxID=2900314 RepID=A0AAE9CJI4_9CAUD|nr:hypothetical protein PQD67_gp035 [Klebsiella phage vB_KpnS-Carvaje]UJQ43999.1 hypothetical protein vBKpnSCarvaje_0035 [Klebsiella phage vB_KpnS-Carvaje]UYL04961.1 hypothetical protein LGIDLPPJ_00074 [Klebsiella phage KP13-27]DAV78115.1 MAG TPA: restriction alleviation protein [Caudoviricetes sp.]